MPVTDTAVSCEPQYHIATEYDDHGNPYADHQYAGSAWIVRCLHHETSEEADSEPQAHKLAEDPSRFCATCAAEWADWERQNPVTPTDAEGERHRELQAERRIEQHERLFDRSGRT